MSIDLSQQEYESVKGKGGAKTSIVNYIDMSKWRRSTKIEALVEELTIMQREDAAMKSIVFSLDGRMTPQARQTVNMEDQAFDRIHRLGQHRPIRITRLIIENSIESRILQLQEKKKMLFQSTVGKDMEALAKLSEEDLAEMVTSPQDKMDPKTGKPESVGSGASRRESTDPVWYGTFTQEEIDTLGSNAIQRLRTTYQAQNIKPLIATDVLKHVQEAAFYIPRKKKWWAKWKKGPKETKEELVMSVALCKSIEYASMPIGSETTFNLCRIPIIAHECISYLKLHGLKSNGLFRVNGSERRMAQLAIQFDAGPKYGLGFNFEGYTVYDVADFLKKYVRGLPEPLLASDLYLYFIKSLEIPVDNGLRIKVFRWLLMLLPPPHLVLMQQLLELLSMVVEHADVNQMTSNNLARIFSPNILKPKSEKQALEEFQSCSFVLEFMIENHEQFAIAAVDVKPFEILDMGYITRQQKKPKYFPKIAQDSRDDVTAAAAAAGAEAGDKVLESAKSKGSIAGGRASTVAGRSSVTIPGATGAVIGGAAPRVPDPSGSGTRKVYEGSVLRKTNSITPKTSVVVKGNSSLKESTSPRDSAAVKAEEVAVEKVSSS
ncbi:hypothetical protein HDU98_007569 [Podochytrium sp. JEL0797]|nr:hypothetical protein HDU98_007569 [Podochytrium sp. JEL0797]